MSKRYLGNRELINDIASSGILAEAFIIEAIGHYSETILAMPIEQFGVSPLINPTLWKDIASEALNRIENRMNG